MKRKDTRSTQLAVSIGCFKVHNGSNNNDNVITTT